MRGGSGGVAALPQRVRAGDAARHPVRRGGLLLPLLARPGRSPRVFEDGAQRRDFVHVTDVAAANAVAIEAAGTRRAGTLSAYNTGSGEPHTVGEMAAELASAHGGPAPVVTGEFRLGDVRHITADSARLRKELGWHPTVGFAEGMAEFARAGQRESAGVIG